MDAQVRARLTLRNDAMISARERLGWSQKYAAQVADVPLATIGAFEKFEYLGLPDKVAVKAERVANALEIPLDVVIPPGMAGKALEHTIERRFKMNPEALLSAGVSAHSQRLALPVPDRIDDNYTQKLHDALEVAMSNLSFREREILRLRFGVGDGNRYGLDEVAKIFKVTRERVRQIEAKAVRLMQHPRRSDMLVDYLPDTDA